MTLAPSPFSYHWTVVPIDDLEYDISLTLTYDTQSAQPVLWAPPRYWNIPICEPQITDVLSIYNPTEIDLHVIGLDFETLGAAVETDFQKATIPPLGDLHIPLTVTQTGLLGVGSVEVRYAYTGVHEFVTYAVNPASTTSQQLAPGSIYSQTFAITPVVFNPNEVYTLQIGPMTHHDWLTVDARQVGPMAWTQDTVIPMTVMAYLPVSLPDGDYTDAATVIVRGSDAGYRDEARHRHPGAYRISVGCDSIYADWVADRGAHL